MLKNLSDTSLASIAMLGVINPLREAVSFTVTPCSAQRKQIQSLSLCWTSTPAWQQRTWCESSLGLTRAKANHQADKTASQQDIDSFQCYTAAGIINLHKPLAHAT